MMKPNEHQALYRQFEALWRKGNVKAIAIAKELEAASSPKEWAAILERHADEIRKERVKR